MAMQGQTSKVTVSGLCHSVQGTAGMLAKWIRSPRWRKSTYVMRRHQPPGLVPLEFKLERTRTLYPKLNKAVRHGTIRKIYNEEHRAGTRCSSTSDYYVTESSGHNSEYNAWFRKRPDLIERYCTHGTGWNPGVYGYILDEYLKREDTWQSEIEKWLADEHVNLERGHEYAAYIFNATIGDGALYEFNGNVRNFGLIDNLPEGCCVEVPVMASRRGLSPIHVGKLPDHLAILNNISARCEELAVEAALEGDPRKVFHAVCFDPLTSAMLSLAETKRMVDEMLQQNKAWLPQFKTL